MTVRTGQLAASIVLRNPRNIESFLLKKQAAGSRDDTGVYVPGEETCYSLQGSVQPLDGKARNELPEAERLNDAICVLFETTCHDAISPLRIGSVQSQSDKITYNGLIWAVRVVHDMSAYGHLEVYATRLENQNG